MSRPTVLALLAFAMLFGAEANRLKASSRAPNGQAALRGPRSAADSAALLAMDADVGRGTEEGSASAEEVIEEAEKVAAHEESKLEAQAAGAATAGQAAAAEGADALRGEEQFEEEEERAEERKRASATALQVKIVRARGLRFSDGKPLGVTDPYCVCELVGKPSAKVQTQAVDGLHGVQWNHEGQIDEYALGDSLRCSVYEKDALPKNSFLGKVTLTSRQLSKGFSGEVALADAGQGVRAYLRLMAGRAAFFAKAKHSKEDDKDDSSSDDEEDDDNDKDDGKDDDGDDDADDDKDKDDDKDGDDKPEANQK